jgi:hypothetical protein
MYHTPPNLAPAGRNPTHELQRLGGWKTWTTVERYAYSGPDALQGAANRLDSFGGYDSQNGLA